MDEKKLSAKESNEKFYELIKELIDSNSKIFERLGKLEDLLKGKPSHLRMSDM